MHGASSISCTHEQEEEKLDETTPVFTSFLVSLHGAQAEDLIRSQHEVVRGIAKSSQHHQDETPPPVSLSTLISQPSAEEGERRQLLEG